MRDKKVSVMGNLMRDMIKNVMETSLKEPIQTGEFRKNPIEPAWICPSSYEYEIIETEHFKMEYLIPKNVVTGRVILQLHGGGYIGPMKNIYRKFAVLYSKISSGGDVLTIDYRVAPENPYPMALEDAVYAYQWLLEAKKYRSDQIVVAGDSAGGGLALALGLYLRDHEIPMPAGFITMSPWIDLTCSGESHITNYDKDPLFGNSRESMLYNSSYIGDHDPKDPYISPAFGDYKGFSPILIQVGSYEMLLSDSQTLAEAANRAGVKHRISIFEGMFHDFQMSMGLFPESREAWEEVKSFLQIIYGIERTPDGTLVRRVKRTPKKKSFKSRKFT